MDTITFSACLLTFNKEGKVLGVTRKTDHTKWGLPGGKLDPGETPLQAITRELFEETGLELCNASHLMTRDCIDKDGVMKPCAIFWGEVTGEINHNEPHLVAWIDKELLFEGAFAQFNIETFHMLGYLPEHEIIHWIKMDKNTENYLGFLKESQKSLHTYMYSALMIPKEYFGEKINEKE